MDVSVRAEGVHVCYLSTDIIIRECSKVDCILYVDVVISLDTLTEI